MVTTLTTCGVNESGALLKESMSIRPEAIGKIIMFAGNTAPEGTLYCNGAAISRTTYSELFAAIGTTYGAGDGSTTFNVPDLRGRWIVGADAEQAAGEEVAEGLPNILGWTPSTNILTDSASYQNHEGEVSWSVTGGAFTTTYSTHQRLQEIAGITRDQIFSISLNASNNNAIYGASTHVTPASVALLPCIIYE